MEQLTLPVFSEWAFLLSSFADVISSIDDVDSYRSEVKKLCLCSHKIVHMYGSSSICPADIDIRDMSDEDIGFYAEGFVLNASDIVIAWLEERILSASPEDRAAFMIGIVTKCSMVFQEVYIHDYTPEENELFLDAECMMSVIALFCSELSGLCVRYNLNMPALSFISSDEEVYLKKFALDIDFYRPSCYDLLKDKHYTLKSTQRRRAVWALLSKIPELKNVDDTVLAAFVEAVTGGNVGAAPKDTYSYKPDIRNARRDGDPLVEDLFSKIPQEKK